MSTKPDVLRILLVTARYFPYIGGIETHNYEVARRLAHVGAKVTVLTTDPSGQLPVAEESEGVSIRRLRAWPAKKDYYFAPGIYRVIKEGCWDIVHCQGVHTFVPPLGMLGALQAKIPYVVTFHTGTHSSRFRNAIRGVQWALLRPLLVQAEQFISVSKFEAEFFRKRLHLENDRFIIIPNGADLPPPTGPSPINIETTLIISIGRLECYKGHQRIIAALPKVREQCPSVRLLILGSGPYESELRLLTKKLGVDDCVDIRMIAASDRQGMASTLSQANLVMLMSEGESHPVAIMEALSLGRSVLVANTSGLRELAERGLVQAIPLESSVQDLASAMVNQLRHPLIPNTNGLPTWDSCATALLAVYESVAWRQPSAS